MELNFTLGVAGMAAYMAPQLTTIDLVRRYLGRDYKGTDDALLETTFIPAASEWFVKESSNPILVAPYVDTFDGRGQTKHTTRAPYLRAVTSVVNDGLPVQARTRLGDVGYVVDDDQIELVEDVFRWGVKNCSVAYTAGFDAVPYGVALAVAELAIYLYRERDRVGVFSRSGEMGSVQYQVLSLPVSVQRVIEQYRVPPEK